MMGCGALLLVEVELEGAESGETSSVVVVVVMMGAGAMLFNIGDAVAADGDAGSEES